MKNDDKRALAFRQYILFLCYKQPVLIHKKKSNNVGKADEDLMWWPESWIFQFCEEYP